ncbi:MAG: energy transducer TonB [Oceanicaulis sp.]|nr:energy transducer TonB [Oceanicaulis sp.]
MRKPFLLKIGAMVMLLAASAVAQDRDRENSQFLPLPAYPRDAAIECIQGEVLARFIVSETFQATQIEIVRSMPENIFEDVVLEALDRWVVNAEPGTEIEELFEFELESCG